MLWDFDIPENTKLLIIPDAGSNDVNECKKLSEDGIDVLILDHHHYNMENPNSAIVVNNQTSNKYANKDACGAHVTFRFLQALDDFYWNTHCTERFSDLVAIADIADVMNLTSFDTRAMVNFGLCNIQNKMIEEIISAQEYSMKGIINPHTIAFYVAPLINGFLRLAPYEDRCLVMKAFCEEEGEMFEYVNKKTKDSTQENIYQHCVRIMKSYKAKQDRIKNKFVPILTDEFYQNDDCKVAVIDMTGKFESALSGVVAIKLSENLNKPVLLLNKRENNNHYGGSGRAFDYCPIDDFRDFVDKCAFVDFAQGHASAFGVGFEAENLTIIEDYFNKKLHNVNFKKI